MPKLLDYLLEGGIQGRYFVGNRVWKEEGTEVRVYQVTGYEGIEKTIPHTLNIEICYLNKSYGNTEKERTRTEMLGQMLEHEEATSEQITAAVMGTLIKHTQKEMF